MLVLTRKVHQSIMIGDDVEVVVTAIKGEQVRLGITAPREIPVHRKEIYQLIHGQGVALPKNGSVQNQPVS
ncbi:MAG: carbon storage regulator CsrA [Abditibacteriales bacterium]|nr:carbon storage regulator CsrA [Abditibacteriales bacterium]MDW8366298.1 carbon storage regulator CsrA [Abditibacteriales bacterium]